MYIRSEVWRMRVVGVGGMHWYWYLIGGAANPEYIPGRRGVTEGWWDVGTWGITRIGTVPRSVGLLKSLQASGTVCVKNCHDSPMVYHRLDTKHMMYRYVPVCR